MKLLGLFTFFLITFSSFGQDIGIEFRAYPAGQMYLFSGEYPLKERSSLMLDLGIIKQTEKTLEFKTRKKEEALVVELGIDTSSRMNRMVSLLVLKISSGNSPLTGKVALTIRPLSPGLLTS